MSAEPWTAALDTYLDQNEAAFREFPTLFPEAIDWFWQQRIVRGALNILVGMPDRCKGQITAFLSARAMRGGSMPCLEGYLLTAT